MIDPHLSDWWTRHHRCQIALRDDELSGAGASLRVLLHAFPMEEFVWYSLIFGDIQDDVLVLAVDRAAAAVLPRARHSGPGPVATALGRNVDEYRLDEPAQAALGVDIGPETSGVRHPGVRHWIYVHDDAFFSVEAVDARLLAALVSALFDMHGFYLGSDADWTAPLEHVLALLPVQEEVTIESHPPAQKLIVRWRLRREGLKGMFRRFDSREYVVSGGK